MSDAERPKRKALGRGITDAIDSPDASATSNLLAKVKPRSLTVDSTQLNSPPPDSTQVNSTQLAPIAPARDFNKRANSLDRDALPAGLFPGTSKKLYDALYLRTRGAIVPVRSIQATRSDLMRWAGIGGLNTFLSHMKHFTKIGLIVRSFEIGNKEGALYEVRLPEEIDSTQLDSTQLNSTQVNSPSKRVLDSTQKLSRVESSNPIDNKATSGVSQTSFNTNTEKFNDDDAALAGLNRVLIQAAKELTGKEPARADTERWAEIGEVLVTELKIAAVRTSQVSSVPAFLAEHLRRRLFKKDKKQMAEESMGDQSSAGVAISPSLTQIEVAGCPDCGGSGWWYPQGPEKGVAKCRHDKLTKVADSDVIRNTDDQA